MRVAGVRHIDRNRQRSHHAALEILHIHRCRRVLRRRAQPDLLRPSKLLLWCTRYVYDAVVLAEASCEFVTRHTPCSAEETPWITATEARQIQAIRIEYSTRLWPSSSRRKSIVIFRHIVK
jgi:hypothetical protein